MEPRTADSIASHSRYQPVWDISKTGSGSGVPPSARDGIISLIRRSMVSPWTPQSRSEYPPNVIRRKLGLSYFTEETVTSNARVMGSVEAISRVFMK
jgi:hypothetical protein